jgi:predicted nucleotidyltransferase
MKNNEIIPQYIQDEINNLVKKKSSYTKEEIDQIKRDFDHVIEQRKQLEEAENFGAIPKEEAAINSIFLMAKQ